MQFRLLRNELIMKLLKNIFTAFICLFSFQGCAQHNPDEYITVEELKERIYSADTSMVIIDVRTNSEVTGPLTKINGAVHIPVQEISERFGELEKFKDKNIILICRTQNRSSHASEFLKNKGYKSKFVKGGMQEYYK